MDKEYSDIELLFIEEVLDQHGEYVVDLLQEDIASKELLGTEENLLDSVNYNVVNLTSRGGPIKLEISFFGYGRAIEIRLHKRSQNTKKWAETNTNQSIWNIKNNTRKWKNTRWYSKNVYGSLNRLIGILGSEYSDATIARLKGILQRRENEKI